MLHSFADSDPKIAAARTPITTKRDRRFSLTRPVVVLAGAVVGRLSMRRLPDGADSFKVDLTPTFETERTASRPPRAWATVPDRRIR